MKKKGLVWLVIICMAAGIGGCGKREPAQSEVQNETENAAEEEKNMLRNGVNHFAYQLYGRLDGGENVFFSPYSLCSALSLLNLGAGTETKKELETLLGISDMGAWSSAMKAYLETEWTDETFVLTANSIWLQQGEAWAENIEADFLNPGAEFFKSELYEATHS